MALTGPHAEDAFAVIERALLLTPVQARALSDAYETDSNDRYYEHCSMVQDALAVTGRVVESGWLEHFFLTLEWARDTKALHAVADAVMAILVADMLPESVVQMVARPWISLRVQADLIVGSA